MKKMKERERGLRCSHLSTGNRWQAQRERERERERERDLYLHVSRGSRWRRERDVLQMGSLLLLLLSLSAPGRARSAIKAVTTTTAPTKSLFWRSSNSPDDDDDHHHHHPRATQESIETKQANVHKSVFSFFLLENCTRIMHPSFLSSIFTFFFCMCHELLKKPPKKKHQFPPPLITGSNFFLCPSC